MRSRRTTGRKRSWSRWSGWIAFLWATCSLSLGVSASPLRFRLSGFERFDLVGHAGAAGLLAVLVGEWLLVGPGGRGASGVSVGPSAPLPGGIEVKQITSTVRSFKALDLVADLVGAGAGVWLYAYAAAAGYRGELSRR